MIKVSLLSPAEYAQSQAGGGILSLIISLVGLVIFIIFGYLGIWLLARVLGMATNLLDKKIFKKGQEED